MATAQSEETSRATDSAASPASQDVTPKTTLDVAAREATETPKPAASASGDPWATRAPETPIAGAEPRTATVETPPAYYVDRIPEPPSAAAPRGDAQPARPMAPLSSRAAPPMRLAIEEPPPPPVVRHRAPRNSFWLGARTGWWVPFGDLWGDCDAYGYDCQPTRFSTVASSGPMLELDVGARFSRNYNVYLLWERAQLGSGSGGSVGDPDLQQRRAETDYLAVGIRLSADPDDFGLLLDLSVGARRFVAKYSGRNELQLTDAPLETRLGIGADIRMSRTFSLSPMLTLGLGAFGKAEWVTKDTVSDAIPSNYDALTHGWATLQMGGHFDLGGSH